MIRGVEYWVRDLIDPETREDALLELSKQREKFPALAPYLWHSYGTIACLLQVRAPGEVPLTCRTGDRSPTFTAFGESRP